MSQKLQVFISYKHHDIDGAIAQKLYDTLGGWGFDVWMDRHNIPAGVDVGSTGWISAIDKGLRESQVLFGLISDDALLSENVQHEWRWAKGNNRRIFLIKVRDFNRENMSHQFFETLYLNYPDDLSKLETDLRQFAIQRANFIHNVTDTPRDLNAEILRDLDTLASQAPKKQPRRPLHESRLFLRTLAFLIFIVGVIWLIVQPGFEPLLAFLTAIVPLLISLTIFDEEALVGDDIPTESDWNILKDRIRRFWLESLLRPALQEAAALNIQVSVQTDMVIQHRELGEVDIPRGSINIRGIFDELKSFVIVGKAGAGKTITLLQLVTKLLLKPPANLPNSIPFPLNLSSWGNDDIPFDEWMLKEAQATYRIRRTAFTRWLKGLRLIILLDGLDEIRADELDRRTMADRIQKLNTYRREHSEIPMVICTRPDEYKTATDNQAQNRLDFDYAIQVEPLDEDQILAYLSGDDLKGLRELYKPENEKDKPDEAIRRFAKIPFLLVTMAYTYRGVTKRQLMDNIAPNDDLARQDDLFRKYLIKQLQVYPSAKYDPENIRPALTWLATKTTASGAVFSLRNVTIDWFKENERLVRWYNRILSGSVIFIPTLLFGLAGYSMVGILGALGFSLLGCVIGLQISEFSISFYDKSYDGIRFVWFSTEKLKYPLLRQIVPMLIISSIIMPLVASTVLVYGFVGAIFLIMMRLLWYVSISDRWLLSGFIALYAYTINEALAHDVGIKIILGVLLSIGMVVFIYSMDYGQPTLSITNHQWRWHAVGTFLVNIGLMLIFPALGWWWLPIITIVVFGLMTGIIPLLVRLALLHFYTQRQFSPDYNDLIQTMTQRQFLRPFAGGHTFRHDYMRQSFLGGGAIVKAQIKVLIPDLADERVNVRVNVKKVLAEFRRDVLIEMLVPALHDPKIAIWGECAELLAEKGWQPQTPDEILWFAFAKLDFDTLINQNAFDFLIPLLKDRDKHVRYAVACTLGKIGNERAVKPLIPLLKDKSADVRYYVAGTLGEIGDARAVDALIPLLNDEFFYVRGAVAIALGKIGDARAVDHLIPLLKDTTKPEYDKLRICDYVAEALRKIGTPEALQALHDAGFDA